MEDFKQLFERFKKVKVGVIGDVMLDSYVWGKVERISPEAPVPIVSLSKKENRIGGAGNVALNCRSLGAEVFVVSVTGNEDEAKQLDSLFEENKVNTGYLIKSNDRVTTNKTRIICRNQQMLRLDAEVVHDLNADDESKIIERVKLLLKEQRPDVIIFEDYNKGVLTQNVITEVISLCKENNILTAVDPKRKNFFSYTGVDIFKPNLHEIKDAFNLLSEQLGKTELSDIHQQLREKLRHSTSFITLSERGVFYQRDEDGDIIASHIRNVADVSGAGDTVIAVASLVYTLTKNVRLMAEMANIAGGLVCEEVGTAAIDSTKFLNECELLLH
jgi:rfaE bifunctional protein kinase chain/domain